MVLFVGDKPSSKNKDVNVAFVGTRSYATLTEWSIEVGLNYHAKMINRTDPSFKDVVWLASKYGFPIIAFGKEATKALSGLNVDFYEMPHPSGKNFKLNDKQFLKEKLKGMRTYLLRKGAINE
jgi:nicotinic acid phosphoribosyltransferase